MTTTTSDERPTLPAVECAPWCEDDAGHTDAESFDDQWCSSEETRVLLTRMPMVEWDTHRARSPCGPTCRRTATAALSTSASVMTRAPGSTLARRGS